MGHTRERMMSASPNHAYSHSHNIMSARPPAVDWLTTGTRASQNQRHQQTLAEKLNPAHARGFPLSTTTTSTKTAPNPAYFLCSFTYSNATTPQHASPRLARKDDKSLERKTHSTRVQRALYAHAWRNVDARDASQPPPLPAPLSRSVQLKRLSPVCGRMGMVVHREKKKKPRTRQNAGRLMSEYII